MKFLRLSLIFCIFTFSFCATAQTFLGNFEEIQSETGNEITLRTSNGQVKIEFISTDAARIRTSWNGEFAENEPWMVVRYDWPQVNYNKKENDQELEFSTDKIKLKIGKKPFAISILDRNGKVLLEEHKNKHNSSSYTSSEHTGTTFKLQPDEHFFGFGERMDFLDRRGKKLRLNVGRGQGLPHIIGAYNPLEANYSPVPFFMSTAGYGLFLHNAHPTNWDMGHSSNDTFSFNAEGGELDYYVMYGPDFSTLLDTYTNITGKSPLLPKFALGLHVGTYSGGTWGHEAETSTQYVIDLAKKFRTLGIPLDVLHLDSTWRFFGENGGKGATTFEWRETFKNPKAMFDSLYALNLNAVGLHLRPRFDNGKTYRLLDKARKGGYVYPEENGEGEFVNFFDKKSVDWWWKEGVKNVADQGAMFLKTDEGSAFGHKANESDKVGPQGEEIKSLHNLFPLAYAKAPFEKFQEYNKIRGMNHTREGYAGIQRYPFIFAGDWPSEWQYFEPVIKAGLNIGLSGVGNWAHCMGGFEHVADPELYIRWTQFGLLSPIAHLFGMEHPNYKEPWNYGEEATRIFKFYDEFRYQLIPYLYSTAYQNHNTGKPLMRALVLDNQDDANTYEITDQYLLGESMMVCPVVDKGAKTRVVYLPEGEWTNYWTKEVFQGKQHISVLCPLDQIPIFIKGGAIIPMQKSQNYIGENEITNIDLHLYPKGKSAFTLYADDGKSLNYTSGEFATTIIETEESEEYVHIKIQQPKGSYVSSIATYTLTIHLSKKPSSIAINNNSMNISQLNYTNGVLQIEVSAHELQDVKIVK
ncbi:Alpha-glucosidase, glycosyl hydrolase family GH31 [Maribacter sedimenticola]|uniref:Alpha-glucosidase, glycosyl hydrolase family GH31 n=1 Tax=Maribacter sedimenticola TaxID=228956 RepID=A0ABY1SD28_9FLAO|nr:TIM-barrel domain-containing protein [Maribacter sedimenticola]SNR27671.1 Alpha-glucosidase, glycosyl hydrolase family GH31 [Maribacter sedimenticola]